MFEIAVTSDMIPRLLGDRRLVFAENKDADIYNQLGFSSYVFARTPDKGNIFHRALQTDCLGLVDRDYLTDSEIVELRARYPNLRILPYYSIESLLGRGTRIDLAVVL